MTVAANFYFMGRPSLGERRQVGIRLRHDLINRVDMARGPMSRDSWFALAAEQALKPGSQVTVPELKQDTHTHTPGRPLRTEWKGEKRVRYYECATCGAETAT